MADTYTERSSTSYFSRIKNSLKGILIGIVFLVGAAILLFWNEGRAVRTEKGLKEGAGLVVSVASDSIVPANEGKLVHLSGMLSTGGPVADDTFQVSSPTAIRLERVVEMYQWRQNSSTKTEKKLGGGEESVTTYSYDKVWSERLIASGEFKQAANHQNPSDLPYPPSRFTAPDVRLGAFALSEGLLAQLSDAENLPVTDSDLARLPDALKTKTKLHDGRFYFGSDPAHPQVGDARVAFRVIKPSEVTIIGQQRGDSFEAFATSHGTAIQLLSRGQKTAPEMFAAALSANRTLTWILRAVGLLFIFLGLRLILGPLAVLADVLPWAGSLVGAGVSLIAFLLALAISLAIIGIAWLYYRPMLGISLLAGVVALLVLAVTLLKKNRPAAASAAA